MTHPDPARLRSVPLFEGLSDAEYTELASWFTVDDFTPDHNPVRQSAHGYAFFVVDDGRAHVEVDGHVLEVLEPGSVFGEMAFFEPDSRRTATVVPEGTLRVLTMFGTHFREMQARMPQIAQRLEALSAARHARDAEATS
jgi:CRP-like cAMP-binding protein